MKACRYAHALVAALVVVLALSPAANADPVQFESPHIHPMCLSANGNTLYVVNTPDSRLSIFDLSGGTPVLTGEVKVGLEPVSVAQAADGMLWVSCHLSDAISIVDPATLTVRRNIIVGDEPADVQIVDHPILDDGSQWAIISLSQEDRVIILDAAPPYAEVASIDIPGSDPRALAITPDGQSVWVAVFESGNQTILAPRELVFDPNNPWGGLPPPFDPPLNPDLPLAQFQFNSVILKRDAQGLWMDEQGGDWTSMITWEPMDIDLVRISLAPFPTIAETVTKVGTMVDDIAVDSETGDIWAANFHSKNHILFESKLEAAGLGINRVSKVNAGGVTPQAFRLNQHLDAILLPKIEGAIGPVLIPPADRDDSLAFPTELLFANLGDGTRKLFVTSIGGKRVAVINPGSGAVENRLPVPEGGTGLVYDGNSEDLIMLSRFDNSLHMVDPATGFTGTSVPVGKSGWDPTPTNVKAGRRFLYTGEHSSTGGFACASCHPYGNMDNIAWDLGNPDGEMQAGIPPEENQGVQGSPFHPLKGPMTTQTLRGLKDTFPLHWRGDQVDFLAFNDAFETLLGGTKLSVAEMDLYNDFIMSVVYPPNPFRSRRDELPTNLEGGDATVGQFIFEELNNGFCVNCHSLPTGTNTVVVPLLNFHFGNLSVKVAQMRNMYEKTGFDDMNGPNKRVYGYLHDGADNNLETFILEEVAGRVPAGQEPDAIAYMLSFTTGTHPSTGVQTTCTPDNVTDPVELQIVTDLMDMATEGHVDLVAHGNVNGEERGWVFDPNGWASDRFGEIWTVGDFFDAIVDGGTAITFLGVPKGEGIRMGVDRDMDGSFDRDELDQGTDPADPNQVATSVDPTLGVNPGLNQVTSVFPAPFSSRTNVQVYLTASAPISVNVYDLRGRKVTTLANGSFGQGRHEFAWDGKDGRGQSVASGSYFIRLQTPEAVDQRKVMKVR